MNERRSSNLLFWLGLISLALIQLNGALFTGRVDLTENRVHTLSAATVGMLASLSAPVTIRYYVSERLQREFAEPQQIEDVIRSYAVAAPSVVDVRIETVDVNRVETDALPLIGQPLSQSDANEQSVATVYSGIVIEYLDREFPISFVFDYRDLEYRITTGIRSLSLSSLPVISTLSARSGGFFGDMGLLRSELAMLFSLNPLRSGEEIPPSSAVAIIDASGSFDSRDMNVVARFLDNGGNVLLLADPVTVQIDGTLLATPADLTTLNDLLRSYGVELGTELLLDEPSNPLPVQELSAGVPRNVLVDYPLWPTLGERNTSAEHPLTTRFGGLDLYWPGIIRLLRGHPAAPEALVASSPHAWLMERPYSIVPGSAALNPPNESTRGQYATVVQSLTPSGGKLLVVSDTDFVRDALVDSTGSYWNIDFFVQAVQYLANEGALLDLRSRAQRDFSLSAIEDPQARNALQRFAVLISLILVPVSVAVVGVVIVARRRRRGRGKPE